MQVSRDWPTAALVCLAVLFILPLWCVTSPAMPDYPAHLAGFHLIGGGAAASPYYAVHWRLLPNLASDIAVPLLAMVVPLEIAVKLFLTLAVVMWVAGAGLIQRAVTGRIGPASLAGALFAGNANFTWGFLNYTFAAGLSFMIFAAWIVWRERQSAMMLAGFAAAVFVLFVCHLFGMCVLAILIGGYELAAFLRARDFSLRKAAAAAVPVVVIFLPSALATLFFKSAGGEGGGIEFNYGDTIADRFGSAAQWAFSDPAYLVIGGLAILILAGLAYGKLRLHPAMKLLVLLVAILTLIAPEWALGGWGVDMRLPPVLGVITFASLELRLDKRLAAAFGAAVVLVGAANAWSLTTDWVGRDRQIREFRTALADLPRGARLFTVLDSAALNDMADQPYWHMAEFVIVDKGGFTPLMFATKGQHVIEVKEPYDRLAAATAQQGSPPDVTELASLALGRADDDTNIDEVFPYLKLFQCHFDYAVVVHGGGTQADVPSFMHLQAAGSFFSIYKVTPNGLCATL
jgi:hypothetical protein